MKEKTLLISYDKQEISSSKDIHNLEFDSQELDKYKEELIFQFELNLAVNKNTPVDIISDDCFTNILFLNLLKSFFGTALFNRYFGHTFYSPKDGTYNDELFENVPNNQIIILLGSFTDINSVDEKLRKGKLFDTIKRTISSKKNDKENNNIVVGVCFGGHVCGTLSGHDVKPIVPHFKNLKCELTFDNNTPEFYKKMLEGLSKDGNNNSFVLPTTNRQYVSLNPEGISFHILAKDEDGLIAIAGCENEKCIFIQPHPEINSKSNYIVEWVHSKLLKLGIESEYMNQSEETGTNIGLSVYLPILLESIKRINSNLINDSVYDPNLKDRLGTDMSTGNLDPLDVLDLQNEGKIRKRIDVLSIKEEIKDSECNIRKLEEATIKNIRSIIDNYDISYEERIKIGQLLKTRDDFFVHHKKELQELFFRLGLGTLNGDFNWSVSRNNEIASEVLGLKNLHLWIHERRKYLIKHGVIELDDIFPVRELGPGDLSLISEFIEKDSGDKKMIYYGMGNKIYYKSFYNLLIENFPEVPMQVLKVITHKFFDVFNMYVKKYSENSDIAWISLSEIIIESIDLVEVRKEDKAGKLTMFGCDVKSIGYGDSDPLDDESILFLQSSDFDNKLEEIKKRFRKNPLKIIDGIFHKMLLSDFSDIGVNLRSVDPMISNVYLQYDIRAMSHSDSKKYIQPVDEVLSDFSGVGFCSISDSVFESFTFINRIEELLKLKRKYGGGIDVNMIYDPVTNYISSVIVEKKVLGVTEEFNHENYMIESRILLDIEEVSKSSFFKIENFFRVFIYDFFDNDKTVFWYFHDSILELVRITITKVGKHGIDKNQIFELKLKLVNLILLIGKDLGIDEKMSEMYIFHKVNFLFDSDYEIKEIFENGAYIPKWQNIESNRKK